MNKADSHLDILTHEPEKTTVNLEDLKEHNVYPDKSELVLEVGVTNDPTVSELPVTVRELVGDGSK